MPSEQEPTPVPTPATLAILSLLALVKSVVAPLPTAHRPLDLLYAALAILSLIALIAVCLAAIAIALALR
jgi:hypothetical protein